MKMQFRVGALPVAAAFIVYGFQAQNPLAFLAAIIILLAAMYIGADGTRHVTLVTTYLYTIVEPKVEGLQWETMYAESRKRQPRFFLRISYPISICIYALVCIGCLFLHGGLYQTTVLLTCYYTASLLLLWQRPFLFFQSTLSKYLQTNTAQIPLTTGGDLKKTFIHLLKLFTRIASKQAIKMN